MPRRDPASALALRTEITVIGAGQAGLSAAYHLRRAGLEPYHCASEIASDNARSENGGPPVGLKIF
jgi:cation diffusion facilitator CzcD-associated flavoprotein CzcO